MKIGLYFGSFNPVHSGHLIIASHILNEALVEKVWFIVSPQNPFKQTNSLLNEYNRLHLLRIATENDPRLKVSDIEFSLPRPSYTSVTLSHLTEKHPGHEFSIIMGSDSFQNLTNWKNASYIIGNYTILVYERPGFAVANSIQANIEIVKAPLLQISSTHIRNLLKEGKSARYLLPEKVLEEIEKSNYYKK